MEAFRNTALYLAGLSLTFHIFQAISVKRGSAAAGMQGLRVRIPPGIWMSLVNVMCCQVEVSASG